MVPTYFILSLLTLIIFVGVIFLKSGLNYYQNNSKIKRTLKSAFDVPSLFNQLQNKNQIHFNWNAIRTNEEKHYLISLTRDKAHGQKDFSTRAADYNQTALRYTHITKRMAVVSTR
jgi:hypothetical protein